MKGNLDSLNRVAQRHLTAHLCDQILDSATRVAWVCRNLWKNAQAVLQRQLLG